MDSIMKWPSASRSTKCWPTSTPAVSADMVQARPRTLTPLQRWWRETLYAPWRWHTEECDWCWLFKRA